jgi:hypothetical protein
MQINKHGFQIIGYTETDLAFVDICKCAVADSYAYAGQLGSARRVFLPFKSL